MKLAIATICLVVSVTVACAQGVSTARDASGNLIRDTALSRGAGSVYPPGANVLPRKNNFSGTSYGPRRQCGNVWRQTKD
jgi:hypothetical protein